MRPFFHWLLGLYVLLVFSLPYCVFSISIVDSIHLFNSLSWSPQSSVFGPLLYLHIPVVISSSFLALSTMFGGDFQKSNSNFSSKLKTSVAYSLLGISTWMFNRYRKLLTFPSESLILSLCSLCRVLVEAPFFHLLRPQSLKLALTPLSVPVSCLWILLALPSEHIRNVTISPHLHRYQWSKASPESLQTGLPVPVLALPPFPVLSSIQLSVILIYFRWSHSCLKISLYSCPQGHIQSGFLLLPYLHICFSRRDLLVVLYQACFCPRALAYILSSRMIFPSYWQDSSPTF